MVHENVCMITSLFQRYYSEKHPLESYPQDGGRAESQLALKLRLCHPVHREEEKGRKKTNLSASFTAFSTHSQRHRPTFNGRFYVEFTKSVSECRRLSFWVSKQSHRRHDATPTRQFCRVGLAGGVNWILESDVTEETFRRHLKTFVFNSLDS